MMHLTVETSRGRQRVCPQCGHPAALRTRSRWIETTLGVLALAAVALMLLLLGIVTWKACGKLLFDQEPHSIFFRPLEDWTPY